MKLNLFAVVFLSSILFILSSFNNGFFYSKLNWDEVDYVNAAEQGIIINALDGNDPSFIQFTKFGIAKYLNDPESIKKIALSMGSEETQLFMLRHFHPPLPIYYWSLFIHEDTSTSDLLLRSSSLIFFIFFAVIFLLLGNKYSENTEPITRMQALLAISFFASPIFFLGHWSLNFHIFHALACVFFSYCLKNYLQKPNKQNEWLTAISLAGLFLTLETGIFVAFIGFLILCFTRGLKFLLKKTFISLLLKSFVIFIMLWPGALFSGGPLKSWLMYLYRIFANSGDEYATVNILSNYKNLLFLNPFLSIVSAISILLILSNIRKSKQMNFIIPLILGTAYCVFLTPFALNFTYFIPALSLVIFGLYTGLRRPNA
ncbi:hypothetical protein N9D92_02910 [Gammaproteobacteria bacterium]|nr:hypothetical protein [Gammaproteobacteria bacterium]